MFYKWFQLYHAIPNRWKRMKTRGAVNILEGGSKSSEMLATVVDRRRKFYVTERLKW